MSEMNRISLRTKLGVVVAVGMMALFAAQFSTARVVLLSGYSQLEQHMAMIQVGGAAKLLADQVQQLEGVTADWAQWDDTYRYMAEPSQDYIETNYSLNTFRNIDITAVIITDSQGEMVFAKGFDAAQGQPWPIPKTIELAAANGGVLREAVIAKGSVAGVFAAGEGVYLVSAHSILPTSGTGNSRGTLAMVRPVGLALQQHIGQVIDGQFSIEDPASGNVSVDSSAAVTHIDIQGGGVVAWPVSDQEVAGYALVENIAGPGKLVLRTAADRHIFKQGQSSLNFLLYSMGVIVLVLGVFSWLFDKVVLSRLAQLHNDVERIGERATVTERLQLQEVGGHDELSSLAFGINGMLERLDQAQKALHFETERAQATLAGIADAVITSDVEGRVTYMNKAAEHLTGLSLDEAMGKTLQALFRLMQDGGQEHPVDSSWLTDPLSPIDEVILGRGDGHGFVVRKSAAELHDPSGNYFGAVTVLHDVTALRSLSRQLIFQARHDALTGLINRYEFDRIAQKAMEDAVVEKRTHCLAYIDLDQFKAVNDTCGHMAGDMLLRQIAAQLKGKVRSADTLARLGGDEFAVLLTGCSAEKGLEVITGMLQAVEESRFTFDGKVFKIGASIGLTEIVPEHSHTLSELLSTVDAACYAAKEAGGNRIHVYRPDDKALQQRNTQFEWLSRIHQGLEKNQFVLYIQRMECLKEGTEQHAELLIRMMDDDGTLYPPGYFLPVAERYHLMPMLDRWVIREALAIIARKGPAPDCVYAINLSGQTLSDEGFLEYVVELIKGHGVDVRRLCFEITETAVIANLDKARQFIRVLRGMGCRFSLDDFGSGLSSFAYLKNLEVDYLKIDGMFVKTIVSNKIDRAMVESINHVGHVMGLHNIAEFAESEDIIHMLREIGVDYAQGYGVAKPERFC